ncbi:adenosylcobinamide-phosphate synthase CbiB [Acidisphaera rubrifaciens]|uniref:Cobalamin biosynthesis protein CobD n=1 Tax=Acidisphaera rubrifaciens HS-AP3 TaxID=1231350 RepID=A0A0D6P7H1_9PROT|nr:adenosylcobinamide-phosphate synthase CbiB [Acidisphaera rubrifaciens]GAN76819.1 cobalamin (vitamin B12) biosynthesis protein CobD/CbiB [Acidisphaera rubrifaciens HS-AP3]
MTDGPAITAAALILEATFGYPDALLRRIGHPVMWVGALIAALDRRLNDSAATARRRRVAGVATLALALAAGLIQAAMITAVMRAAAGRYAWLPLGLLASTLLASRSLHRHVADVGAALMAGGPAAGRIAVAHIVGRDPEQLDTAAILRAAIESLAENASDGVVAPAFWCAIGGLPGIVAYKVANTADSMIGHLNARHADFGRAAARFDDAVNLIPARLSAVWLILAAATMRDATAHGAWRVMRRDGRLHRSPNAGWPEAAMAGALGLRLGGPRVYGEEVVAGVWLGDGRTEATPVDLDRALRLYRRVCALQIAATLAVAIVMAFIAQW